MVWRGRALLHKHRKLGIWLPCGGHIEKDELPDEAAIREVFEEAGVEIVLVGERALAVEPPRQLVRPRGVQLERIAPGHEHIDLIYFAVPAPGYDGALLDDPTLGWYAPEALSAIALTDEIRAWLELAFAEIPLYASALEPSLLSATRAATRK